MADILCYHCFARFPAAATLFKCLAHEAPLLFRPTGRGGRLPVASPCPRDGLISSFRVCPRLHCHQDLPFYAGRIHQRIVAVTGCQGTGKTVYFWALLHQVRERLTLQPRPFAVTMFEDDASFETFRGLDAAIRAGELPEMTRVEEIRSGSLPPVVVRLLREGGSDMSNLIFYDPAGELFENLNEARYLRYLAHSAGIIYLVTLPSPTHPTPVDLMTDGLNAVVNQVRRDLGHDRRLRLPQPLAVVITKADEWFGADLGMSDLLPQGAESPGFWFTGSALRAVRNASARCEARLRSDGLDDLVTLAQNNFRSVRFFVVSGLGAPPLEGGRLEALPRPLAVEVPLFWVLRELD